MEAPRILAVAFDCFGTLLRITTPTNPWRPETWLFGHTHLQNKGFGRGGTLVQNVSVGSPDQMHPDDLLWCVIRSLRALPHSRKP